MKPIPVILGPTASGKSPVAAAVAERLGAAILSVDSMKIYRGMDIGTAKPGPAERAKFPYELIDIRNPDESYSVAEFYEDCRDLLTGYVEEARPVILEGGTALYMNALLNGICGGPEADWELRRGLEQEAAASGDPYFLHKKLAEVDPETASRLHPHDMRRIIRGIEVHELTGTPLSELQRSETRPAPFEFRVVGLEWERQALYDRIHRRVDVMFEQGLLDEVRQLEARYEFSREARQAVGYKEVLRHLAGEIDFARCGELVKRNTRRLAKHQLTWYRGWKQIRWIPADREFGVILDDVIAALQA